MTINIMIPGMIKDGMVTNIDISYFLILSLLSIYGIKNEAMTHRVKVKFFNKSELHIFLVKPDMLYM